MLQRVDDVWPPLWCMLDHLENVTQHFHQRVVQFRLRICRLVKLLHHFIDVADILARFAVF